MPKPVSAKQRRYMHAIMNSSAGSSARGDRVPRSVASKYTNSDDGSDLPESKGKEHEGGVWGKKKNKKKKKDLKKAFEQYYRGSGAGVICVNSQGQILMGKDADTGKWSTPGGHVDPGETFEQAAIRELEEETGIKAKQIHEIKALQLEGNDSKIFYCDSFSGKPKDTKELKDVQWVDAHVAADEGHQRFISKLSLKAYFDSHLVKSRDLTDMLAIELLEKNVLRGAGHTDAVFEMNHGDALKLVGTGTFRWLQSHVKNMQDEDFKDINVDSYILSIRKHANDIYSGRVNDGHKTIHQFTHRSLPEICAELMSLFEWYLPEDEPVLQYLDGQHLDDDAVSGGLKQLIENYNKHQIGNIYEEVENIRREIRQGNAVDLQQCEARMMKLFDQLEKLMHDVVDKHNKLTEDAGNEVEDIEMKLRELADKIDKLGRAPQEIMAVSSNPRNPDVVHANEYMYLSKPEVTIEPSGRIRIRFGSEWTPMEKENFLQDMRARAVSKG